MNHSVSRPPHANRARRPPLWQHALLALALGLGSSGCVTATVWHAASHTGAGCDDDALKVLLVATPALLALDLVLMPYQVSSHCYPYGHRYRH